MLLDEVKVHPTNDCLELALFLQCAKYTGKCTKSMQLTKELTQMRSKAKLVGCYTVLAFFFLHKFSPVLPLLACRYLNYISPVDSAGRPVISWCACPYSTPFQDSMVRYTTLSCSSLAIHKMGMWRFTSLPADK